MRLGLNPRDMARAAMGIRVDSSSTVDIMGGSHRMRYNRTRRRVLQSRESSILTRCLPTTNRGIMTDISNHHRVNTANHLRANTLDNSKDHMAASTSSITIGILNKVQNDDERV